MRNGNWLMTASIHSYDWILWLLLDLRTEVEQQYLLDWKWMSENEFSSKYWTSTKIQSDKFGSEKKASKILHLWISHLFCVLSI